MTLSTYGDQAIVQAHGDHAMVIKDVDDMATILSPAQKAWATRRANGFAPAVKSADKAVLTRPEDAEVIMSIGLGESNGIAQIIGSFSFAQKGKPIDSDILPPEDKALLSLRLIASTSTAESGVTVLAGYDTMRVSMPDGTASDIESILPTVKQLDSVISTSRGDSEDSSFPMAVQAVSWFLRVHWIDCEGKRTKRGNVYTVIEQLTDSVLALYPDKQA